MAIIYLLDSVSRYLSKLQGQHSPQPGFWQVFANVMTTLEENLILIWMVRHGLKIIKKIWPREKSLYFLYSLVSSFKEVKCSLREKCQSTEFFWAKYSEMQTRKNSVFGHFSHSGYISQKLKSTLKNHRQNSHWIILKLWIIYLQENDLFKISYVLSQFVINAAFCNKCLIL